MPCPNCCCQSCLGVPIGSPVPFSLPPSELVTTNCAPINSEVASSRDVIRSLEGMVSLIQAKVDVLEKQKADLLSLLHKHKAAISPVRSFPPELLAKVFAQSVDMVEGDWYYRDSPPLMLMGICSRWRRIVLDTPRLWTKILTAHPMIDSWITGSKNLPLHLELDLTSPDWYAALDALVPHSHRWEHVDFRLGPRSIPVLARVKTRLHSLKRLNLYFGDTSGTVDFCEVAPQLTEVKLTGVHGSDPPVVIKLPWEQLRVCTVDDSDVAHYVLQHARNLRELHLDGSLVSMLPHSQMPLIEPHSHHLGLNTLIIEWNSFLNADVNINYVFFSTTLPSLGTLKVCFDYADPDDTSSSDVSTVGDDERAELAVVLAEFFERSCAHLSTLELTDIPFSPAEFVRCLAFAPSLVFLDIYFNSRWHAIDEKLLRSLDVNRPNHVLPRLHSLTFRGSMNILLEESLDALVTLRRHIDPKHDGVALLENLTFEWDFNRLPRRLPRFHRFVSEGLNITYGEDWLLRYDPPQNDKSASLEEQA